MDTQRPHPLVIVKLGSTFEALRARQGDFEHWIADGLGVQALPLLVVDPRRGDALPDPALVSGVVVTGSHAMVSHREPWSEATAAWLAQVVALDTPVLGICYGHQLLAHALGGEAGDHPLGAEVGTVTVSLDEAAAAADPLLNGLPARFPAHAVHWQSALRLPEGAVRLAGNEHEPIHAFRVGGHAWGVQFHPEFDADAMRGYIEMLAGELASKGADPVAMRERVVDTDAAASLLGRFARIVETRHGVA
ncbi:glutamine amidotransferase [Variovorax sp. NFACC27]|uniref:glutamine amidotransferase n=1 Tax=unclassified Variovorax TaxID=663243 RepID=UPI000894ADD2|nr:GMP synthase (glutamine-hydrolysing) [Variovorax sp. NFACC28]SEG91652.1 GMP synthase (glutamine-hydrolysing) [Variovorax sp. NFACC29]SFD51010.1 GMP synthase (glutamine-hydrolysing) [Variovorax sp. NFACC26]SFG71771.1 GMP synthase (glutamine-hydrolysing) [Variovorax sp. NFACC27]